jgi:putative SOS response-associated peptidase YedK
MCGRFVFDADKDDVQSRFKAEAVFPVVERHFNVTPGMFMPIVVRRPEGNVAVLAKWGLVPFWARDPTIGYRMINARAEGIADKPAFRKPFRSSRCLVPTTGFYEWKRLDDGEKVPFFIRLTNEKLFAFAGIYDTWRDAEDRELITFSIITTGPNRLMAGIHDRMPVIFGRKEEDMWLDPQFQDTAALSAMLSPFPESGMETHSVGPDVNNPQNDTPELIAPSG